MLLSFFVTLLCLLLMAAFESGCTCGGPEDGKYFGLKAALVIFQLGQV